MIARDLKLVKHWLDFEAASTHEYAEGEVRAAQAALTKYLQERERKRID